MKKIKKYKAAYLDKNANPRKIPTNKDVMLEFCLNEINKNNKKSLIVGIGLNLAKNPIISNYPTTNLNDLINKKVSKKKIEIELKNVFEKNLSKFVDIGVGS